MSRRHPPQPGRLLTALVIVALAADAGAVVRWRPIGPDAGLVGSIAVAPSNPSVLYAAGLGRSAIFRTDNGGAFWLERSAGLAAGGVSAIAVHPTVPDTVYAATHGIFKTTDGGVTWARADAGLGSPFVDCLAIDPTNAAVVYAGTADAGLWKSVDEGAHWNPVGAGIAEPRVHRIAIAPTTPPTVYAATIAPTPSPGRAHVYRTTSGGSSWTPAEAGFTDAVFAVGDLAVDPHAPATLYAATSGGGILVTTTSGDGWTPMNDGLENVYLYAVVVDASAPGTLWAATFTPGIFKTTNGGGRWSRVDVNLAGAATSLRLAGGTLFAAADTFSRSTDGGATWTPTNRGIQTLDVPAVATSNGTIFASVGPIIRSTDAATWAPVPALAAHEDVSAIVVAPSNPSVVYAGWEHGGARSADGGGTWADSKLGGPALAVVPTNADHVYGNLGTSLARSVDGGKTLVPSGDTGGRSFLSLAVDPVDGNTVYVGTGGGLFRSPDAGVTLFAKNDGLAGGAFALPIRALIMEPDDPTHLTAATPAGLRQTTDGAEHWTPGGLDGLDVRALFTDPTNPGLRYAATSNGVRVSGDRGATWSALDDGLGNRNVLALAADPTRPGRLVAGTKGGSLYLLGDVCGSDAECDDHLSCSTDVCDPAHPLADARGCVHENAACTCTTAAECDDGNRCTLDACAGTGCTHAALVCPAASVCEIVTCSPGGGCGTPVALTGLASIRCRVRAVELALDAAKAADVKASVQKSLLRAAARATKAISAAERAELAKSARRERTALGHASALIRRMRSIVKAARRRRGFIAKTLADALDAELRAGTGAVGTVTAGLRHRGRK